MRQSAIVDQSRIATSDISIVGCGALGSAAAMALAKMGVNNFTLYDEDGVDEVNLPNQMYRTTDVGQFKVDALASIIQSYNTDAVVVSRNHNYTNQALTSIVIVATDNMYARRVVWEQFCKQSTPHIYIEARMGSEEGQVYSFTKTGWAGGVNIEDNDFYQERLYSDEQASQAPCTERAIIYNVFMVAALICRIFKARIHREVFPRELVFGMRQIHKYSFQIRE